MKTEDLIALLATGAGAVEAPALGLLAIFLPDLRSARPSR